MLYDLNQNRSEGERNRIKLINLLRDKSQWPEKFGWLYASCYTCAMGLACRKFGWDIEEWRPSAANRFAGMRWDKVGEAFDLTRFEAERIFLYAHHKDDVPFPKMSAMEKVTPDQIADLLEATLTPVEQLIDA